MRSEQVQDDTLSMNAPRIAKFHLQGRASRGFTLVELMVVIAMLAILIALAAPSWTQLRNRTAIRTMANDYTNSLYLARSEAVQFNMPVTVCPSSDGQTCTNSELEDGWIVRLGMPADANPVIRQDVLPRQFVRTAFTGAIRTITFLPNGQPAGLPLFTVRICPETPGFETLSRNIVVNQTGRARLVEPGVCEIP
jgi:type IV fimbrial biogenesis protein FimT